MLITIFGATGLIGKELVNQALNKEHIVRAYGRNVHTAGFNEHTNLQLIQGALFDEEQVYHAIQGSDAVLSAIDGTAIGTDKTRSLGMKNISTQMQKATVKRIIAIGDMGLLNATDEELLTNTPAFQKKSFEISMEHYKAYEFLQSSDLDWTFVCPPAIIDVAATGLYHVKADELPFPNHDKINSGDLAMFMLHELLKNEYIRKRVGISN